MLTNIPSTSSCGCCNLPGLKLNSRVPRVLFISFRWPTVADYSLDFSVSTVLLPLSPQVVQMA